MPVSGAAVPAVFKGVSPDGQMLVGGLRYFRAPSAGGNTTARKPPELNMIFTGVSLFLTPRG